jgi:rubredoxin
MGWRNEELNNLVLSAGRLRHFKKKPCSSERLDRLNAAPAYAGVPTHLLASTYSVHLSRFMHRPRPLANPIPAARQPLGDNLDYCGFECPACGYQHRLSEEQDGVPLAEIFRFDSEPHALCCPECGTITLFARTGLKLFRDRGED